MWELKKKTEEEKKQVLEKKLKFIAENELIFDEETGYYWNKINRTVYRISNNNFVLVLGNKSKMLLEKIIT